MNWIGGYFMVWCLFYLLWYGLYEINVSWEFVGEGCDESDVLCLIVVYLYCLDMYVKDLYVWLGWVDFEGLWYWCEILIDLDFYGIEGSMMLWWVEVEWGCKSWDSLWYYWLGDEWLVVNLVEILCFLWGLDSCRGYVIYYISVYWLDMLLVVFFVEIIEYIFLFLDLGGIDVVVRICWVFYIYI